MVRWEGRPICPASPTIHLLQPLGWVRVCASRLHGDLLAKSPSLPSVLFLVMAPAGTSGLGNLWERPPHPTARCRANVEASLAGVFPIVADPSWAEEHRGSWGGSWWEDNYWQVRSTNKQRHKWRHCKEEAGFCGESPRERPREKRDV